MLKKLYTLCTLFFAFSNRFLKFYHDQKITPCQSHNNDTDVFRWVIYYRYGNAWSYKILNRKYGVLPVELTVGTNKEPLTINRISVTVIDITANDCKLKEFEVK